MRDFFAIVAIVLAVIGLGVFRVPDENALVAAGIKAAADGAVYQEKHPVSITVKGREITAAGRVETEDEARQIEARLAALEGVEQVVGDWTILPNAAPFTLDLVKSDAGYSVAGFVPNTTLKQEIAQILELDNADLTVAAGVPDGDWADVVRAMVQELSALKAGHLLVSDHTTNLSGTVNFPADKRALDQRLSHLPDAYEVTANITVLDDGTPYRVLVAKDPLMGARFQGKIPPNYQLPDLSELGGYVRGSVENAPVDHGVQGFEKAVETGLTLLTALPQGSLSVTPGGVAIDGGPIAMDIADEIEQSALQGLPDGYAFSFDWTPEADTTPLSLVADWDGQTLTLSGHVPSSFLETAPGEMPDDLAPALLARADFGDKADVALTRSPFPDLTGWEDPFWQALPGLRHLQNGQLVFDENGVQITGTAADPLARRLAHRAVAGGGELDLMLQDDGAPPKFLLSFDVATGATVEGKLPAGLSVTAMAEALGLKAIRGTPPVSPEGDAAPVEALLAQVQPWMTHLDGFVFSYDTAGLSLVIKALPGQNSEALTALMTQDITGAALSIVTAKPPLEGTRRTHSILDQAQIFSAGYWLPSLSFSPSAEACNAQMDLAPEVGFDTGRFEPSVLAYWPLAHHAAIARICARFGDLQAEISAEVGSSELPILNKQLSRRRAEAMRMALIARGVPENHLSTVQASEATGPDRLVVSWR